MISERLSRMIADWDRSTRELADAFLQLDKDGVSLTLEYTHEFEIIFPYKRPDESEINLVIRPTWTKFGDTDAFLKLYQDYLDYANGPGKGLGYYSFIANMPGREKGYWFNNGDGPLTVKGEFVSFLTPIHVKYRDYVRGSNYNLPFSITEEHKQVLFANLSDKDSIEGKLCIPETIRSDPKLYILLLEAGKR